MAHITTIAVFSFLWLFVVFAVKSIFRYLTKRRQFVALIDRIPGPPAVPILGSTYNFPKDRIEYAKKMREYVEKYGKEGVMRVWLGRHATVYLTKAETAEPLLSSTTLITKSPNYQTLVPWLGTGLLISTGQKWKSRRKVLTPTFHYSILESFVDVFAEQADILIEQIRPTAEKGETFDAFPYIKRCTLDIICSTAMGVNMNSQVSRNCEYLQAVAEMNQLTKRYNRTPWLWLKPVAYLTGHSAANKKCLDKLIEYTSQVIRTRETELRNEAERKGVRLAGLKPEGKRLAFLDLLLLMADENKLDFEDIRQEVDTFMFEGHDTTASGIGWALFLLGHHPEVQEKIFEELQSVVGNSDDHLTTKDLKQLKYLERVLKETLRLYPPVPNFGRTLTEDLQTGGYTVPKGTIAIVTPMYIHRFDPVYGPDPEKFDPDRFLPERWVNHHPFSYVPFSAGSRNCIGQKFALMEEKIILATIIRNYKIKSVESVEKVIPLPEIVTRPSDGFKLRFSPRN